METVKNDVTVIGAGLAGICASVMAARKGLKVALIGDRPVLGGNSSSEMRMWTRGATGGENVYSEEMGILGEMKLVNLYRNKDANIIYWDEVLFDFVFAEENIQLFLNTHIDRVKMEGSSVYSVKGIQQGSERKFTFKSSIFIDATGDGTVGFLAGAQFTVGREGKEVYGERFAPEKSDPYGLGSSLFFHSKLSDAPVEFIPPDYAYTKEDMAALLGTGGRIVNEHMSGTDFWWLEYGGMRDTITDNQDITLELKKIVYGIWDYIKNSGKFEADYLTLEWVGSLPCKRESRRLRGEYVLKQQDVEEQKYFDDGVCYGGWYMDFHPPEGIYSQAEFCVQTPVSVYSIPMRCFYTREVDNLLFTGRTISVTHAAFSSTRIMNTCALNGQAAGMIAAYMKEHNLNHHAVYERRLSELKQDLLKHDMYIPGVSNADPLDKALQSEVSVSSCRSMVNDKTDRLIPIKENFYFLVSNCNGKETISLKIDAIQAATLIVEMLPCEFPAGFRPSKNEVIDKKEIALTKGKGQWVTLLLSENTPECMYLRILKNEAIHIHLGKESFTGFIGRYENSKYLYHPCFKVTRENDREKKVKAENLINGCNRNYGGSNIWMSDLLDKSKPEWIKLSWKEKIPITEIRLYFNPDLSMELVNVKGKKYSEHHGFSPRNTMPPELVKEYRIVVNQGSNEKEVVSVKNNIKRMAVHNLTEPVTASSVKVELLDTWGANYFEVYEIRVY